MGEAPLAFDRFATLRAQRLPRATRVVAWLLLIGIAATLAIMIWVPWVQTAAGGGQVISLDPEERPQAVTALVPGRIDRWFVHDGQAVRRGQPVARIVDLDPDLPARLAAERDQVLAEIAATQQARAVAGIDIGRSRELLAEGLASRRDYEQAQIKVADATAKLAESRAKLNRVDVQRARQTAQLVRAPIDGRVQGLNAAAGGALVSAGTALATIAPEPHQITRAVELFLDGRDAALVRVGRPVRLEFEGWPAIQFSGWPSVAQGLFDGRVRSIDPGANAQGLFRILVEPAPGQPDWPNGNFVRLGAKVRGWVRMDTVAVGYELWRRLNDFPLEFRAPAEVKGGKKSLLKLRGDGQGGKPADEAEPGK